MRFAERVQVAIRSGMAASKDLAARVAGRAKDLGAVGVLKLEIVQLESQAEKLTTRLGGEVYATLVVENKATVNRDTPSIRGILREFERLHAQSGLKQKELLEKTPSQQSR